jgi:hypothetical protein
MDCKPLISDPFQFPRKAKNRAGLPRIAYRIGRYDDFVEAMIRRIDAAPELTAWTHRDPDDPGIALLEGAAILSDILSFYQEHYANEAYLRTAAWRESVAELVRLTGYRLAPGLGGRATLAFEARGKSPVVIRQGFPVKLELDDSATPADFQTDTELTAWPHLGRFNLYRKRMPRSTICAIDKAIELTAVDAKSDTVNLAAFDLKKGDQLMLMPDESMFSTSGTVYRTQAAPQLIKVAKVTPQLGRIIVELESALATNWYAPVRAYRIGRSFRHFGHNAPPTVMTPVTDRSGNVTGSHSSTSRFERYLYSDPSTFGFGNSYSALLKTEMPLDIEAPDLAPGRALIVLGTARFNGQPTPVPFAVTKRINGVVSRTLQWGNLIGASTVLKIDSQLITNGNILNEIGDIRELRFFEATSLELRFAPLTGFVTGTFLTGANALYFYGTADEVRPLAGRQLYLSHPDGRSIELVCTNAVDDFAVPSPDVPKMWPLSFDRAPSPFTRADFDESTPSVTVFGNLVDASQGKQEREAVLGNGDSRQSFQTFPLPKAPLTYSLSAGAIPPQVPELEIWVNDRLWKQVHAFYGHGPKEQICIVREDAEGRSFVQFGDGECGARLPSGIKNVKAVYRTGIGARGEIKPGATPTASERPPGFDKVMLAGIVSGGADPETLEKAREAAPGKVQSLGRLVSLRDYETETLAIPGVVTVTAAWDLHAGVPAVILRVLLEAGREAEFGEVRTSIAQAQRCRGPDRFALVVQQAVLRYVFLDLIYARDPSYRHEDVEAALRAALGLAGDQDHERTGLFGQRARRLGEVEYASRIEGRLQNVAGVLWCKVSALGLFAAPVAGGPAISDPSTLVLPAAPRPRIGKLNCGVHELLQLATSHLTLTAVAEIVAGECV